MLLQAATLKANVDAVRAAQNSVKAMINSGRTGRSEPIQACSEVVKFAGQLTELATNFPSRPHSDILAISRKITGASADTCSGEEKKSLHALDEAFDEAVANILEALDTTEEQLWIVTGRVKFFFMYQQSLQRDFNIDNLMSWIINIKK